MESSLRQEARPHPRSRLLIRELSGIDEPLRLLSRWSAARRICGWILMKAAATTGRLLATRLVATLVGALRRRNLRPCARGHKRDNSDCRNSSDCCCILASHETFPSRPPCRPLERIPSRCRSPWPHPLRMDGLRSRKTLPNCGENLRKLRAFRLGKPVSRIDSSASHARARPFSCAWPRSASCCLSARRDTVSRVDPGRQRG